MSSRAIEHAAWIADQSPDFPSGHDDTVWSPGVAHGRVHSPRPRTRRRTITRSSRFLQKYVFSTDHKIIAMQYMFTGMAMAC